MSISTVTRLVANQVSNSICLAVLGAFSVVSQLNYLILRSRVSAFTIAIISIAFFAIASAIAVAVAYVVIRAEGRASRLVSFIIVIPAPGDLAVPEVSVRLFTEASSIAEVVPFVSLHAVFWATLSARIVAVSQVEFAVLVVASLVANTVS